MKKTYYFSLYTILIILLSSCNLLDFLRDEPKRETDEIIVPEISEDNFQEAISAIDLRLNAIIGKEINNVSEIVPYIESIEKEEWVENVELEGEAVFIKVRDGGLIALTDSSFKDVEEETDTRSSSVSFPADKIVENIKNQIKTYSSMEEVSHRYVKDSVFFADKYNIDGYQGSVWNKEQIEDNVSMIGQKHIPIKFAANQKHLEGCKNRKVLIADCTAEQFPELTKLNHDVKTIFENWFGIFDVDYLKGGEITIEFLQNHLTDYGLVFLIAHGFPYKERTYIQTDSWFSKNDFYRFERWKNGEIVMVRPNKDGSLKDKKESLEDKYFLGVGPGFFKHLKGSFAENSIMVGFICNSLTYEDNMWKYLEPKGLGALIGYRGPGMVMYADEAFNSVVRLLINPANSEIMNPDFSSEVSINESYEYFNHSPHFWGAWGEDEMLLMTNKDNIALFSTISEEAEVNLGYPSLFASRNLGASAIQYMGDAYELFREDEFLFDGFVSGTSYDPATRLLEAGWSTPTSIDFGWLLQSNITYDFDYNGRIGTRFTGMSGESIFIPNDYLQCGDHGVAVAYDFQKDTWNQQDQASYFMFKTYNGDTHSDEWQLLGIDQSYYYFYLAHPLRKEIHIFSTLDRYFPYIKNSSIRPVKRNEHPLYKDVWNQIDATTDKQLTKVKLITVDDVVSGAKYHYPDYKIKVSGVEHSPRPLYR